MAPRLSSLSLAVFGPNTSYNYQIVVWFFVTNSLLQIVLQFRFQIPSPKLGKLVKAKVIIHKSRGEVSLVEQDSIECVFVVQNFYYCQPAQNQPKSHILFHKNCSPRDLYIMTLVKALWIRLCVFLLLTLPFSPDLLNNETKSMVE